MSSITQGTIVVIDDDLEMRSLLQDYFSSNGYKVMQFPLASEALQSLQNQTEVIDVIISDIKMPKLDGLSFTGKFRESHSEVPIILITAFGSIDTAVQAIRAGAFDYIVKPFKLTEIQIVVERAIKYRQLQRENKILRREVKQSWRLDDMVGKDSSMQAVFDLVKRVAKVNSNVLITGESGTGKELIARAIHANGPRSNKPFIAINCTAIPENLLESELFGHAKGSFTGAIQRKKGLFEEAHGGTIFLDEIGDMDLALQAKILRVIQERLIRPVGDSQTKEIDVRIIAATHKDLKLAIRDNRFREDLFFRLSVIPIHIPPLRHRRGDIPLLAEHFLHKYSAANGLNIRGFTKAALDKLMRMNWKGNVRELENLIERTVVLCQSDHIDDKDIPDGETEAPEDFYANSTKNFPTIEELERRYIQFVLEKTGGRKSKASQILGINRRTLYRKELEYGFSSSSGSEESTSDQIEELETAEETSG